MTTSPWTQRAARHELPAKSLDDRRPAIVDRPVAWTVADLQASVAKRGKPA
jgi:hypothetical protein